MRPPRLPAEHVVDKHRVASAVSHSVSTWKRRISGYPGLGGPAASDRILGDRAWPELAALFYTVLAFHGIIPAANLPVEVFALASTLLILLPTALWVTPITDGRTGVHALFGRVFRWRFGIGWWLVVLFGLPVIALLLGLIFGGSVQTADLGLVLIKQLGSIAVAVVVINLWEETVWAGFFQTRLEARFNFVVAAVLATLPFAGVLVPLLLLDNQVLARSVLIGIAGLLILGIVVRLLMGVMMRAAADSVLAVGVLHQILDASNNNGSVVDSLLDGADAGNMTPASRRRTDSRGRRLAALATPWSIRQTSCTASRFPS
jgi:CAAX protease family protein